MGQQSDNENTNRSQNLLFGLMALNQLNPTAKWICQHGSSFSAQELFFSLIDVNYQAVREPNQSRSKWKHFIARKLMLKNYY